MKDLLFLLAFAPVFVLALKHPFVGLSAWVWTIMIVPKQYLWGFGADIRYTYLLALITILSLFINKDASYQRIRAGTFWLMVWFLIHTGIANIFTEGVPRQSWGVWTEFVKVIVFSGLIITILTNKARIDTFIFAMVLGIGLNTSLEALKVIVTGGSYAIRGIPASMMTDNNLFALAALITIPFCIYAVKQAPNKMMAWAFKGITFLSIVAVLASYSRGGLVGLIILGLMLIKKDKNKYLYISLAVIMGFITLQVAPDRWLNRMETISDASEDQSFLGRVTAWKLATVSAIRHPLTGTGQDSVQTLSVWQTNYGFIHLLDFIPTNNISPDKAKAAHSIYFQVLGDAGFVGLGLFLLILLSGLRCCSKLSKQAREQWQRELARYSYISLLVYMVAGSLLSMAYYDLVYAIIALNLGIKQLNKYPLNNTP